VNFNLALAILFFKKLIIVNKIQQVAEVQEYTQNLKVSQTFRGIMLAALYSSKLFFPIPWYPLIYSHLFRFFQPLFR